MGIDPGQKGGMAVLSASLIENLDRSHTIISMPQTEQGIWDWFKNYACSEDICATVAMIERVHSMPGQGVVGMFKFGKGYGGLRMALTAANIPFEDVTPRVWQKALGIEKRKPHTKNKRVIIKKGKRKGEWGSKPYGGETTKEWKKRLLSVARRMFPHIKEVTLETCDALLIAAYCRLKELDLL